MIKNQAGDEVSNLMSPFNKDDDYFHEPVSFKDCEDHYELIYTGEFESVGRDSIAVTKMMQDLKNGNKDVELHIFINSIGGDCELLSMILQQVLQYKYRVTVCCGAALSAGFILWACGNEKYVSPYSELMYHTVYSGYEGKGGELTQYGIHVERLAEQLIEAVNMKDLISEDDLEKGKSTEVWYTGDDFINNDKAKDYNEYLNRQIPLSANVILSGNRFFAKSINGGYVELLIDDEHNYTYRDLLDINMQCNDLNVPIEVEPCNQSSSCEEDKPKRTNKKKKK